MKNYSRRQFLGGLFVVGVGAAAFGITGCSSSQSSSTSTSASAGSGQATEVTLTDAAGRTVTLPTTINKVYCAQDFPLIQGTVSILALIYVPH